MKRLTLIYDEKQKSYWPSDESNIPHLAFFLTDDVGKIEPWKEWIADPANQMECGNYSFLEKQGEKIIIKFVYDEVDNIPNAVTFETNAEQLNYILDRWQEAREKKPKKIIITKDDEGKITVDFED